MIKTALRALSAGFFLALSAANLQAASITVTGIGFGHTDVEMYLNNSVTPSSEYAVEILVDYNGNPYIAYCLDLFTAIGYGTYNTTLGGPETYINGTRLAWVYETYAPGVTSHDMATAIQLALWDIVHDNGDGLSAGNIQIGPSVAAGIVTAANNIVNLSLGQSSHNATILHNTVVSDGAPAQTLITAADAQIPEPSTVGFIAMGAALTAFGWKRRKTAK